MLKKMAPINMVLQKKNNLLWNKIKFHFNNIFCCFVSKVDVCDEGEENIENGSERLKLFSGAFRWENIIHVYSSLNSKDSQLGPCIPIFFPKFESSFESVRVRKKLEKLAPTLIFIKQQLPKLAKTKISAKAIFRRASFSTTVSKFTKTFKENS